jgi:tetratricopeptide (TPR) repeat protein
LAGASLIALGAALAPAQAQQSGELQDLFRQVLANPSDAAVNIRYAQAAERKGELRKALAAYERIILADPNNSEARAEYERIKALLEPATTRYQIGFGIQYESNVKLEPHDGRADMAGQVSFRVDDDRHFGTTAWRSSVQLYGDVHLRTSQADFSFGSVSTGPVFTMGNGWRFHPSLTAEAGAADYDFLYYAAGLGADIDTGSGWFRGVSFGAAYADFTKKHDTGIFTSDNGRDAVVLSGKLRFGWDNLFTAQDLLMLTPAAAYNIARSREDRFWQVGATATYVVRMISFEGGVGNVYLAPEFTLQYRDYDRAEPGHGNTRHDTRIVPGVKLIGTYENKTVVLSYAYDDNMSNYKDTTLTDGREYKNHRVGLNFYVDF